MSNKDCTYCKKPLGKKYSFSYGIPNVKRTFACDRRVCKVTRVIKQWFRGCVIWTAKKLFVIGSKAR